jgi:hypothetical protein
VAPPLHSSPPEDLPLLGDIFSREMGISVHVLGRNGPGWSPGIDRPTVAAPPFTGISGPTGDECCAGGDGDSSLTWGVAGPAILADHRSFHGHDGEAVFVGLQGCGTPVLEGPPLVFFADVFPICTWCFPLVYAALASPVPILT